MGTPLDIWGNAGDFECFKCGNNYNVGDSDAPLEYRTTYCSALCYEKDHVAMEQQIVANAVAAPSPTDNNPEGESEGYTTSKIGDFILKVRRKE